MVAQEMKKGLETTVMVIIPSAIPQARVQPWVETVPVGMVGSISIPDSDLIRAHTETACAGSNVYDLEGQAILSPCVRGMGNSGEKRQKVNEYDDGDDHFDNPLELLGNWKQRENPEYQGNYEGENQYRHQKRNHGVYLSSFDAGTTVVVF